jgi:hypothetical protein
MPPKQKVANARVIREHGAETQLQPIMQNSLRSILRQRSAEPELSSYRSRSHLNILNPPQKLYRIISPPPSKRQLPRIRTKSAKKSRYDTYDTSSSDSDSAADRDSDKSSNESLNSNESLS